jgi:formate dehydrogenase
MSTPSGPSASSAAYLELAAAMRDASICGLGQAAPNPIDCVVKYFPHELVQGAAT